MTNTQDEDHAAWLAAVSTDAKYSIEIDLPAGVIVDGMRHLGGGRFEFPLAHGVRVPMLLDGSTDAPENRDYLKAAIVKRPPRGGHRAVWFLRLLENGRCIKDNGVSPELWRAWAEINGVTLVEPGPWQDAGQKAEGWYELDAGDGEIVKAQWNSERNIWWPIIGKIPDGFSDRADVARWRAPGFAALPKHAESE